MKNPSTSSGQAREITIHTGGQSVTVRALRHGSGQAMPETAAATMRAAWATREASIKVPVPLPAERAGRPSPVEYALRRCGVL